MSQPLLKCVCGAILLVKYYTYIKCIYLTCLDTRFYVKCHKWVDVDNYYSENRIDMGCLRIPVCWLMAPRQSAFNDLYTYNWPYYCFPHQLFLRWL